MNTIIRWGIITVMMAIQMTTIMGKATANQKVADLAIDIPYGFCQLGRSQDKMKYVFYTGEAIPVRIILCDNDNGGPIDTSARNGNPSLFDAVYPRLSRVTEHGEEPLNNPRLEIANREERRNDKVAFRLPGKMYKGDRVEVLGYLRAADGTPLPEGEYILRDGIRGPWAARGGYVTRFSIRKATEPYEKAAILWHQATKNCQLMETAERITANRAIFREMFTLCPNYPTVCALLGEYEQKSGNYPEAMRLYARGLQLYADGTVAPEDLSASPLMAGNEIRFNLRIGYDECAQKLRQ